MMTLEEVCRKVLNDNQGLVKDYNYHKLPISGALIGHVLKLHHTNLKLIAEKIREILGEEFVLDDIDVIFEE